MRDLARHNFDLLSAVLLALLLTLQLILLPDFRGASRIVVGLIVGLIVPGYTFMAALFPRRDDVEVAERVALSFGLSIVTIALLGVGLNYTIWGIQLTAMSVALVSWAVVFSAIAIARRYPMDASERFTLEGVITPRQLFLGVAVSALVVFFLPLLGSNRSFTEFYLLGQERGFDRFPHTLAPGETFFVEIGIVNKEGREMSFLISSPTEGERPAIRSPAIAAGETWEAEIALMAPTDPGETVVTLELFRPRDGRPYRTLTLSIDVAPGGGADGAGREEG